VTSLTVRFENANVSFKCNSILFYSEAKVKPVFKKSGLTALQYSEFYRVVVDMDIHGYPWIYP